MASFSTASRLKAAIWAQRTPTLRQLSIACASLNAIKEGVIDEFQTRVVLIRSHQPNHIADYLRKWTTYCRFDLQMGYQAYVRGDEQIDLLFENDDFRTLLAIFSYGIIDRHHRYRAAQ